MPVHLDFETRSKEENLGQVGAYRYAMDPSTVVMFACFKFDDEDEIHTWFFKEPKKNLKQLKRFFNRIKKGDILKAHNAEFEYAIYKYAWARQLKKLLGVEIPKLKIRQLRCSAAEAAYLTYPRSLKNLAMALQTPTQKDMAGNRVMLKMSKPRKPTKNNPALFHEGEDDYKTVNSYCIDDVQVESECSSMLYPLPEKELEIFHLTIAINERGMRVNVPLAKRAIQFRNRFEEELTTELKELTGGTVYSVNQHAKYKEVICATGYTVPNLQAETVEESLKDPDINPKAKRLMQIRQMLGKSSLAKFDAMVNSAWRDWRVRGTQLYYGATTGRWAGMGMQPHNFTKSADSQIQNVLSLIAVGDYELFKAVYPMVYERLSNSLRHFIIAGPGKTFIDVDWNAIEARIVLWLAGDEEGLQVYYDGIDAYVLLAAEVLEKDLVDVTKDERQYVGKPGVLGCGFGMGYKKLALQYNLEKFMSFKIVRTWRKKHKPVVKFWSALQDAAVNAVFKPNQAFKAGPHITFKYDKKRRLLKCRLPSGRILFYHKPRIKKVIKEIEYDKLVTLADGREKLLPQKKKIKQYELYHIVYKGSAGYPNAIHGSHLCENVTQAVARDIVAEAMLRLRGTEFEQTLSLHDEIKCEMPALKDTTKLEEKFLKIINTPVPWAEGLPLKTEHWVGKQFRS